MSNDKGKNHMFNDKGKNPMFDEDNGENFVFAAFQNLNLGCNENFIEQGESSNMSNKNNINIKNLNFNVRQNVGDICVGPSPKGLSDASLRAPPVTQPWTTQPGYDFSSINSFQPYFDHDLSLSDLFDMMTCPTRYNEFLSYLEGINSYPSDVRVIYLFRIGKTVTSNLETFLCLATNENGSLAIRNLLRRSPTLDRLICDAICRSFVSLMNDKNGRHLIIPTIRAVDKPLKEMLYELTDIYAMYLAKQETGCIALNNVLAEVKGHHRDLILNRIARNAVWLSFDPYGTYVLQNVLSLQNPLATQAISETLSGYFFELARVRQGSYVVEKCLKSMFGREKVLEEFRRNDREWVRLANDRFGNFVAQCALKVMMQCGMNRLLIEFVDKLRPHLGQMKYGHGKNTVRMIEKEIDPWIQFHRNL